MTSLDVFMLTIPFSSTPLKVVTQKDAGGGNVLVNQSVCIVLSALVVVSFSFTGSFDSESLWNQYVTF